MNFLKKSLLSAAAVAAMGVATTANAGVIVDLFTDPVGGVQSVSVNALNANQNDQAGPFSDLQVVGKYRELSITKTGDVPSNPANPSPNVGVSTLTAGFGSLDLSNDTGNKSRGVVTWDGINVAGANGSGVNPLGLGGVDFTMGGTAGQFFADVLAADLGFDYKITVWDMDGDRSTLSAGVQFGVNSVVSSHYLFDWFNLADGVYCDGVSAPPSCGNPLTQLDFSISRSGGAIDFSRIGALQLELSNASVASVDLAIGTIQSVPEPGALALVGLALLGAGAASRRRSS